MFGGESGIRTRGELAPTSDFETGRRARGRASRSRDDDLDRDLARFARIGAFSEASGAFSTEPNQAPDDAVEVALAAALTKAAAAGRFDVVAQLARELEARRLARSKVEAMTSVKGPSTRIQSPREASRWPTTRRRPCGCRSFTANTTVFAHLLATAVSD